MQPTFDVLVYRSRACPSQSLVERGLSRHVPRNGELSHGVALDRLRHGVASHDLWMRDGRSMLPLAVVHGCPSTSLRSGRTGGGGTNSTNGAGGNNGASVMLRTA